MARASFTGTIAFGNVQVGVKAYSIVREERSVSFSTLHRTCVAKCRQVPQCTRCGELVGDAEQVIGIERNGRWYLADAEAVHRLSSSTDDSRALKIHAVVGDKVIDPLWFSSPYYLVPAEMDDMRPYAVFSQALRREKVSAIVTYVFRGKDRLGVVYPGTSSLILRALHMAETAQALENQTEIEHVRPLPAEIDGARRVLRSLPSSFAYDAFVDTAQQRLVGYVDDLIKHGPEAVPSPGLLTAKAPAVGSLLEQLEASVSTARQKTKRTGVTVSSRKSRTASKAS